MTEAVGLLRADVRATSLGRSALRSAWPWLALVSAAVIPYLNALPASFVFDDWIQIRGNPALQGEFDLFKIFAVPLFPGNLYRPLTIVTFAWDHSLFGWSGWWFHAVNVAWHVGVTVLVACLGLRLFAHEPLLAWLGALFFAVHPVHTEAVTGLVGRAELLAAFFALAAILAAARAEEVERPWERRGWMALGLASFTAALLSKESAVTALLLVVLVRMALRGEWSWAGLSREMRSLDWVGFVACALAVFALRALAISSWGSTESVDPVDNILASVPAGQRVATALAIQWEAFSQFVFPLVLSADYSYPQIVPVTAWWHPATVAGGVLLVVTVALALRKDAPSGVMLLFPWVAFAVTSNLLFPIGTVRGERLAYFPSVGWCWWLGAALLWARRRLPVSFVAMLGLALLVGYGARTYWRNRDWRDQATLFARTAMDAPRSSKAHKNHAVALRDAGRLREALAAYERAWDLYPYEEGIAFGMGEVYDRLGRSAEAEQWYLEALKLEPLHAGAWNNLCRLRTLAGRWKEAEWACRHGLRVQAANPNLWKGLGLAWVGAGQVYRGRQALEIALRLEPKDQALRSYLHDLSSAEAKP
ncbi:MAG: hypothetical protein KatS3mg077_3336 [Candidatus Binatia bacterium]|nr:MAG: hypothetical protein KatS3mg077_3336 [Candidatus Binatia bacterium]